MVDEKHAPPGYYAVRSEPNSCAGCAFRAVPGAHTRCSLPGEAPTCMRSDRPDNFCVVYKQIGNPKQPRAFRDLLQD